jgi:hypothetical protein
MKIEKDVVVEKVLEKITEWDANLERFMLKGYPIRLMAQIEYQQKLKSLLSTRRLVEKMLLRFKKKESVPELSKR